MITSLYPEVSIRFDGKDGFYLETLILVQNERFTICRKGYRIINEDSLHNFIGLCTDVKDRYILSNPRIIDPMLEKSQMEFSKGEISHAYHNKIYNK